MYRSPFVAAIVIASLQAMPLHAQEHVASGHAETLLKATRSWNDKPYSGYPSGQPELTMLRVTIEPNTALPWHLHPIPNAGYVLSGELTIVDKASGAKRTFKRGEAFAESVDDVHRGMAGSEPTTILLFYSGVPGKATSVPLDAGQKEY